MITVHNASLHFGTQVIFENLSETFHVQDRIGIVGPNGTGKSTLLKVLAGLQPLDGGTVSRGDTKIAYLPQEVVVTSHRTARDEAFQGFDTVACLLEEQKNIETALKSAIQEEKNSYAIRLADIAHDLSEYHIDTLYRQTEMVLRGLGFSDKQLDQPVAELSVGWRMRVVLARLLLQKADFYLFDEPTNHLDIIAQEWFFSFLQESQCGFLLVSHERYYLNNVCTSIFALNNGGGTRYYGNYDYYEQTRQEEIAQLEQAYIVQNKEREKKQRTINRFRATATKAKMVQGLIRELEAMQPIVLPPQPKKIAVPFGHVSRSGRIVLIVENLIFGFGEHKLFTNASFRVERGEKVAIVAPNGTGKTTLFNLMTGTLRPQEGEVAFGGSVEKALFEQDAEQALNKNKTIFEHVSQTTNRSDEQVRSMLGAFLFSNDTINKKIKVLSGGEKNRVRMAHVLLQDANVLLLDEPTNHLDITSKDMLVHALKQYPGTIIFVSHDRTFVNQLATHVIDLDQYKTRKYEGNYDSLLAQKQTNNSTQKPELTNTHTRSQKHKHQSNKHAYEDSKELKKLERAIERLEQTISNHTRSFERLTYGTDEFADAARKLTMHKEKLAALIREWEKKQTDAYNE